MKQHHWLDKLIEIKKEIVIVLWMFLEVVIVIVKLEIYRVQRWKPILVGFMSSNRLKIIKVILLIPLKIQLDMLILSTLWDIRKELNNREVWVHRSRQNIEMLLTIQTK